MLSKQIKNQNHIAILNILCTAILQGLAFFSAPYFSRVLGTSNYGIVNVYNTWVQVVTIVFCLRINGTVIMGMSEYPEERQAEYQSSILSLSVIVYFVFSMTTICISAIFFRSNLLFIVMVVLQGLGQFIVSFANSKFTFEFKADINLFLSVGVSVSTIGLSIILMNHMSHENNYWGRIIGETIPYVLIGLIILVYTVAKGKAIIHLGYWKFCLPIAIPMVFHSLSTIILAQSDRIMLEHMTSYSTVGIYGLAYSFGGVITIIWSALNNTWVPIYYDQTKKNDFAKIRIQTKGYLELFSIISIGFMLLAPEVYGVFASADFQSGLIFMPAFTIAGYFCFLYSFMVNYEIYYKKTSVIAIGSCSAAVTNIILNYILIKCFDAYGAALATVISYGLLFVFHYVASKKVITGAIFPFRISVFMPYLMPTLVVAVLCTVGLPLIIRWVIAVVIAAYELLRLVKRKSIFG